MKLTYFLVFYTSILYAQELVNPFEVLTPIEEQIGLLPDEKSYYVHEEIYNDDTLTKSRIGETFYNYGNLRVRIYTDEHFRNITDRIVTFQIVNDTFSLQTTRTYDVNSTRLDSMLVYRKEGNIYKVIYRNNNKFSRALYYEYDNGQIVKQTHLWSNGSKREGTMKYANGQVIHQEAGSPEETTDITDILYTDTLVTMTTKVLNSKDIQFSRIQYRLDTVGNLLSIVQHLQRYDQPEPALDKTTFFTYSHGGRYTQQIEHYETGFKQEISYIPGVPRIEKHYWPNENQKMIKTFEPIYD